MLVAHLQQFLGGTIGKITTFRGILIWHPRAQTSLNVGSRDLDC